MASAFTILFLPDARSVASDKPIALSRAALKAGVLLEHPCGSKANCGKCKVRFLDGVPEPTLADSLLFSNDDLDAGWRLSCQAVCRADCVVEVPQIAHDSHTKSFIEEESTTTDSPPMVWRRDTDAGSEIVVNGEVTRLLDGSDESDLIGVAIDIGTTTLAAALVNLSTNEVLAQESRLNPQVAWGNDVISRIDHAMRHSEGNAQLHEVLVHALDEMIAEMSGGAGLNTAGDVQAITVAGNPAMMHMFVGADATPLGRAPFEGSWRAARTVMAGEVGFQTLAPTTPILLLPMVHGNVGADTVAAIIAARIDQVDALTLMVDLGTNSEIVLGNRHRLIATSAAAGPAFEGATISQGMRACEGAIFRVDLTPEGNVVSAVIGGGKARGICGSGLIDAVAALLRSGKINETGWMQEPVELTSPSQSDGGKPVLLLQNDVRQLQLVKGSILAGARMLMKQWGCSPEDLDRVLVAGAFGQNVRKESLLTIGLIPAVPLSKVTFLGNAAGVGARLALTDREAWQRAIRVGEMAEYCELAGNPDYVEELGEAMMFLDDTDTEIIRGLEPER